MRSGVVSSKEGIERYSSIVEDEARRLSTTLDQLMLYSETNSKRKKYKLARIDVNEVIENAARGLSPTEIENCHLTMDIDDDLPYVMSDANALSQCVQNLLSNACKYGHNGGPPHIEVKAVKDERLGEIHLSIADNGPGINAPDRRHLFRPFFRGGWTGSNIPGNGLGLYLVRRIMEALGGRVTIDSPPRGARFTLHIPVAK
jgi:signal transduction histidine kinase